MDIERMLGGMKGRVSFHMPGGKGRCGEASEVDVTELPITDDLHQSNGAYLKLAQRLARANNAEVSFPMVGGSTLGVSCMIMASVYPAQSIIMPRNAHVSAFSACAFGGIEPIFVEPRINENSLLPYVEKEDVLSAIHNNPTAKAIVLTRPDYFGNLIELNEIVTRAHEVGMAVLVDEAHGAHLPFMGAGYSACDFGVDMWTQSYHKTLPALTQCAVLHINNKKFETQVRRKLRLLQTSSPSSVLLLSLERAFDLMEIDGKSLLNELTKMCNNFREELSKSGNYTFEKHIESCFDATRLVIDVKNTGYTGYQIAQMLQDKGIDMEMAQQTCIVGIPSIMSTQEDFDALLKALMEIEPQKSKTTYVTNKICYGERVCKMAQASMGKISMAVLEHSENMVAADSVGTYPPGIPLVTSGEKITKEVLDSLHKSVQMGGSLFGVSQIGEIAVVKKKYDAVIFDLDGTVIDTTQGIVACINYSTQKLKLPAIPQETINKFVGPPLHDAYVRFVGLDEQTANEAVAAYRERYATEGVLECKPYQGMEKLFKGLKENGIKIGIATSKPDIYAKKILQLKGLWEYVDCFQAAKLTDISDTKSELVKKVVQQLGQNCCMVGDRFYDINGARANNIDSCGVSYGFGEREELCKAGATYVACDVNELIDLFDVGGV